MKGSWGLYGHRPRPDSKEWVTNRMVGAPGPCQSQRGGVSPGGGWKQAGHGDECGKETGVLGSAGSRFLGGSAGSRSCPHGAPWHCQARAAAGQQGHSLPRLRAPPPPTHCGGSLATFCKGAVAVRAVPHLPPGSQLDEGTDGLVGTGPAGEHVAPVEGLEEADEVGTLRLLKRQRLSAG